MAKLSKKAKVGVLLSGIWIIVILGVSIEQEIFNIFLILGMLPIVIGWGVRWMFVDTEPKSKKLSKKDKLVVVFSIVWLILLFGVALANFSTGGYSGYGSYSGPNWEVLNIFFLLGVLPVFLGWCIRWILVDSDHKKNKNKIKKSFGKRKNNLYIDKEDDEWCKIGFEYLQEDNFKSAKDCFKEAIKINPKNPWALLNLGYIYSQIKDGREKAKQYYQQVIDLAPSATVGRSTNPDFEGMTLVDVAKASIKALQHEDSM